MLDHAPVAFAAMTPFFKHPLIICIAVALVLALGTVALACYAALCEARMKKPGAVLPLQANDYEETK